MAEPSILVCDVTYDDKDETSLTGPHGTIIIDPADRSPESSQNERICNRDTSKYEYSGTVPWSRLPCRLGEYTLSVPLSSSRSADEIFSGWSVNLHVKVRLVLPARCWIWSTVWKDDIPFLMKNSSDVIALQNVIDADKSFLEWKPLTYDARKRDDSKHDKQRREGIIVKEEYNNRYDVQFQGVPHYFKSIGPDGFIFEADMTSYVRKTDDKAHRDKLLREIPEQLRRNQADMERAEQDGSTNDVGCLYLERRVLEKQMQEIADANNQAAATEQVFVVHRMVLQRGWNRVPYIRSQNPEDYNYLHYFVDKCADAVCSFHIGQKGEEEKKKNLH